MKNLILLLFVLTIEAVSAQVPFAPLGAKWYIEHTGECFGLPDEPNYIGTKQVTGDSTIQGKYCTFVKFVYGPTCSPPGLGTMSTRTVRRCMFTT